jgi:RecA-family ATPase
MEDNNYRLINMEDVVAEEVEWLWEGYIPIGKLTILQGDPGKGKTMAMLNLIAAFTTGRGMLEPPGSSMIREPINVIYQTAEDGLADTVKPRLEAAGADCSRVSVIDDRDKMLSMTDERLVWAIRETKAGLVVLDPLQAYLGEKVDMNRANEVRPVMRYLAMLADHFGCAIVLIGHMNKAQGLKASYRGLGSIDFRAAARSVLLVGRTKDDPTIRVMAQDKNSLAPEGRSMSFSLGEVVPEDDEDAQEWVELTKLLLVATSDSFEIADTVMRVSKRAGVANDV